MSLSFPSFSRLYPFNMVLILLCLMFCLPLALADEKNATNPATTTDSKTDADAETKSVPGVSSTDEAANPKEAAHSQIDNSMANIEVIQQTLESLRSEIDNSKEDTLLNRSSMTTVKQGLALIDSKLKETYSGLDESRNNITLNTTDIAKIKTELLALSRDLRTHTSDLHSQKSLIEGNATRIYEILITIADLTKQLDVLRGSETQLAEQKQDEQKSLIDDLNRLWILLAIILVSLTPLAYVLSNSRDQYKPLPDGTPQHQGVLLVCLGVFLGYFIVGFGLMFGSSAQGWIGTSTYLLDTTTSDPNQTPLFSFAEYALYQVGFVMLAALIIYSAIGRQLSASSHLLLAVFVGVVLVPVFGHWVWSGQFIPGNKGWLEASGFMDAAGSTTIHSIAAWFAFMLVWKLGRQYKNESSTPDKANDEAAYSSVAVLFLWLSWLGFTTGTLPISSNQIAPTMLNVGLSATAAGLMAFLHYSFFHTGKGMIARSLGGFVTGLVAVAASAHLLTFMEALVVGATAGIIHNWAFSLLRKYFLTQAWQARAAYLVAIHGVGGMWGSLCVALFGAAGMFTRPDFTQIFIQLQGIAIGLIYSLVLAQVALLLLAARKRPAVTA